jgi:aminopeptidase N
LAKKYSADAKGALGEAVSQILITEGTEADFDFVANLYDETPPSQEKVGMTDGFINYLLKVNDVSKIKKGIDYVMKFRNMIPEQYKSFIDPGFKKSFAKLSKAKGIEIENYISNSFK